MHDSVEELLEMKKKIFRFEIKCRELDRQYEMNNNGELDNGVYNKFVNNSIRNDDDGDKANEELISNPSTFIERESSEDYVQKLNEVFSAEMRSAKDRNLDVYGNIGVVVSNYNFKIDKEVIEKMSEKFRYPKSYIID